MSNARRRSKPVAQNAPASAPEKDVPVAEAPADLPRETKVESAHDETEFKMDSVREEFRLAIKASAGVPYDHLLRHMIDQGWLFQLRESLITPAPTGNIVTFDICFGRHPDELHFFDRISILVPSNQIALSLWARANATPSAIYAVFGRLPDPVKEEPGASPLSQTGPAMPVEDPTPEPAPEAEKPWEPLDLIEKRTPDGLPIFYDPYALGEEAEDIVNSMMLQLQAAMPEVRTLEALRTFYEINGVMFDFVRDLLPERTPEIRSLFDTRRVEIENRQR